MKQQNFILVGILVIVVILLIRINTENTLEFFEDNSVPYGELLINREGDNLSIYNFEFNTNKLDLINKNGATCLENGEVSIVTDKPKRLETLYLDGLTSFNILVSDTGESYKIVNTFSEHTGGYIHNITNNKQRKSTGRYFKIVNTGNSKNSNVKLELYGVDNTSSQKITMINGDKLNVKTKKAKTPDSDTSIHYVVDMPGGDDHLIYYIKFKTNCEYVKLFYKHLGENTTYKLPCNDNVYNTNTTNNITDGYTYLFFPNPTLVRNLHIVPMCNNQAETNKIISDLSIFGKVVANKEQYIEQSRYFCNKEYTHNGGTQPKPNVVENFHGAQNQTLADSFAETEKLCEALEYQENIKAEKLKIEKNKIYMLKLLEQEQEINNLIRTINKLKGSRDKRAKSDELLKLSMFEKQKQDEAQVLDLVQDRVDNQQNLSVNLNLQSYTKQPE